MSVFVDNARNPLGRMKLSHMMADTRSELVAMAKLIGIDAKYIQKAGTYQEHFDVCSSARVKAIKAGAIPVTSKVLVAKMLARRGAGE